MRATSDHFDASILKISHPSAQLEFKGLAFGERAKTHSLNSARNQVVSGDLLHRKNVGFQGEFGKDFMPRITQGALAAMIDHTLLKPEATKAEIEKLCREAARHNFATVCVQPYRVNLAANILHESGVKVCTVIGFPLGANSTAVKAMEVIRAAADGAREFDMVINIGALKDRNVGDVEADIRAVVKAAQGNAVKVILETCLLTDEEIVLGCQLSEAAGASFVKTSTGFSKDGATREHVLLMRKTVGDRLGVKASGGIRDRKTLIQLLKAGATRIGTSSSVMLLEAGMAETEY